MDADRRRKHGPERPSTDLFARALEALEQFVKGGEPLVQLTRTRAALKALWPLCPRVARQALEHLDAGHAGMAIGCLHSRHA